MSDPFDHRCPRCRTPMIDDATECPRGPDCCTGREFMRAVVAGACSAVLRGLRWLGLVE
jgi:hypothetical protein